MEIVVNAQDNASETFEQIGEAGGGAAQFIEDNWMKLTAASAAAAGATETFARSQGDSNATLRRMAARTGESESELREMIDGLTDATFSSHDAAEAMELLSQRGVENREDFENLLPVFDDFSDATGKDMAQGIEEVSRVLGAFNIPVEDAGDHMDTMTHMSENLGVPLDRLGRQLARNSEGLEEMNIGVDESAAFLQALRDRGMDGRDAMRLFTDSVGDADGDMDSLLDTLDLTADEYADYQREVANASGVTSEYADINNSTMTPMEQMQASLSNLMFRFGGLADVAGMATGALSAVGPVALGITQGGPLLAKALGGVTKAFQVLRTAILTNPLFLIAALLIAIVAVMWHFRDEIIAALTAAWDWVAEKSEALWNWWSDLIEGVVEAVVGFVANLRDRVVGFFTNLQERLTAINNAIRDRIINAIVGLRNRVVAVVEALRNRVVGVFTAVRDTATRIWEGLTGAVTGAVENVRDFVVGAFEGVRDTLAGIWESISERFREVFESLAGIAKAPINAVVRIINGLIDRLNSISVTIPDIPLVPGRGQTIGFNIPRIPSLHGGGIFEAPTPGGEGLAILQDGEAVTRRGAVTAMSGGGTVELGDRTITKIVSGVRDAMTLDGRKVSRALGPAFVDEITSRTGRRR